MLVLPVQSANYSEYSLLKYTFLSKGIKMDMLFVLDIMQVTFVAEPIVDLPTTGFNSQGMGTQTKTSNVTKHMPT